MAAVRALEVLEDLRVNVSPSLYAEAVPPGSPMHLEAQRFQAERFALVQSNHGRASSDLTYVDATDTDSTYTIPIVVRRFEGGQPWSQNPLLATARLELPGATLIESMIRLKPGSTAAEALAAGRAAEVGGFASRVDGEKDILIDAIDGVVAVVVELAKRLDIDWLWIFPRKGFMSIMRASISGLLPPYQFKKSADIVGWNEQSPQLKYFRSLKLRGWANDPEIFEISRMQFAADLEQRQALQQRRTQFHRALERLLPHAMMQAQREILRESRFAASQQSYATPQEQTMPNPQNNQPSISEQEQSDYNASSRASHAQERHTSQQRETFLPFSGAAGATAAYLQAVVEQGGEPARTYKAMGYRLLTVEKGMRLLDVGCGSGIDLPALSQMTGPNGVVVGVDTNPALILKARETIAIHALRNAWVFEADAEHLGFATGEYDRARADRALQHTKHPEKVLAEMWRVLRPGGILTAIEPDWQTMAVYPGSSAGGDDDSAYLATLDWCQRHLSHPRIGRQLYTLLQSVGQHAWSEFRVDVVAFSFYDWHALDLVLQLSQAATMLMQEDMSVASNVASWLRAADEASARGKFFAVVPLFFAYARKAGTDELR